MGKRLFLLLIGSLMTIVMSPTILAATDDVTVAKVNDARVVETVPLPEPEPEPVATIARVTKAPMAGQAPVIQNYIVNSYVSTPREFNSIANDLADGVIYKYRKMVYGHSRSTSLGNLANRSNNETITITDGGVTTSYRISFSRFYTIDALYAEGDNGKILMQDIADTALGHSVALFTCQGNGRLVVYADAI